MGGFLFHFANVTGRFLNALMKGLALPLERQDGWAYWKRWIFQNDQQTEIGECVELTWYGLLPAACKKPSCVALGLEM